MGARINPKGHPARFSDEIVDELASIINAEVTDWFYPPMLWDPFAGTGEMLAEIASRCRPGGFAPLPYGGTEIEPEFIVDKHIRVGDATDPDCYPPHLATVKEIEGWGRFIVVTSPAYPNGMADGFMPQDDSKRYTYQSALNALTKQPRRLADNNMGRMGYRGTQRGGASKRRADYWRVADLAVANWAKADFVLLNVSDFRHSKGEIEPLVMDWRQLLHEHGWHDQREVQVATKRNGNGANRDERVEHEVIVVAKR